MNLSAYDVIKQINYLKTWVDPRYKRLYSRELPDYKFYSFAKKYNPDNNVTDFYIILHNNIDTDLIIHPVIIDKRVTKLYLKDIWNESPLRTITNIENIKLDIDDNTQDDCIIYKIDF